MTWEWAFLRYFLSGRYKFSLPDCKGDPKKKIAKALITLSYLIMYKLMNNNELLACFQL